MNPGAHGEHGEMLKKRLALVFAVLAVCAGVN